MEYFFKTDIGQVREVNEDSVYASVNRFGHTILVVADGMGGHNAGHIASKIAVNKIAKEWEVCENLLTATETKKWLTNIIKDINNTILQHSKTVQDFSGMGTTMVVAVHINNVTVIANIGDSRAYILFEDELIQVTKDQTLVNELVAQGEISEEEAKIHPQKNVLIQAIGTSKHLKIDFYEVDNSYLYLLLCSDGLSNLVSSNHMKEIISNNIIENSVYLLIDEANNKGGHDNISIAILKVGE